MRRIPLLTPEMDANLSPVDQRILEAGFWGADPAGLFQPKR